MAAVDPCLIGSVDVSGLPLVRLGVSLLDEYLDFVAGRCRPNTVLATVFDLKVFFSGRRLIGYLASAVILGPFTLLRPAVAVAGAILAAAHTPSATGKTLTICTALAVLTVEPLADRLWYAPPPQ